MSDLQAAPKDDAGQRPPEDQWPGVAAAYDFVMPSYQLMTARLEAAITRIQTLMVFAATITLGVPVLGQSINKSISLWSAPSVIAVGFFVVLMILGLVARDLGDFMLINPAKLYDTSLHLSAWEFKRDAIFFAGKCFNHNSALANRKADLGRAMSISLLAEVLCFVIWIATS